MQHSLHHFRITVITLENTGLKYHIQVFSAIQTVVVLTGDGSYFQQSHPGENNSTLFLERQK